MSPLRSRSRHPAAVSLSSRSPAGWPKVSLYCPEVVEVEHRDRPLLVLDDGAIEVDLPGASVGKAGERHSAPRRQGVPWRRRGRSRPRPRGPAAPRWSRVDPRHGHCPAIPRPGPQHQAASDQGLIENRCRSPGGDPEVDVPHSLLDVLCDQRRTARAECVVDGAALAGEAVGRAGLEPGDRGAAQSIGVAGRLIEQCDSRLTGRPSGLAYGDAHLRAVEQAVDDVVDLPEHPLLVAGFSGLVADAGHQPLRGETDDRAHRHRQQRRPVLRLGIGGRADDTIGSR